MLTVLIAEVIAVQKQKLKQKTSVSGLLVVNVAEILTDLWYSYCFHNWGIGRKMGNWAEENEMKTNPNKSKALSFTRARVKDPLNYSLGDQMIPEASCCTYLGIIIRSDLSWADQVNFTVQKAWRALHFVKRIVKKGNKNTKSLACTSLVRPILEYGAACWDPYRECQ